MSVDTILAQLTKRGLQRGFLTVHEVQHDLVEIEAPEEEFERVVEVLRSRGIRIEEETDEFDDDLLEDETLSVSDPVKMWLTEIGRYRLLSTQQEVELGILRRAPERRMLMLPPKASGFAS